MEDYHKTIEELRLSQYQTKKHKYFEQLLAYSFSSLGLNAKHKGGQNEPDILIECDREKVTLDAKTCRKNSAVTEQMIGFPALSRYKEKYKAIRSAVVAPHFTSGNALVTAQRENVILIETEAICKILSNHKVYQYNPKEIFNLLFKGGKVMIKPGDIKSSLGEEQRAIIEIIKDLFEILEKKDIGEFTKERIRDIFLGKEKDYAEENITQSLMLLLRLNILEQKELKYRLTRNIKEILNDINILCSTRGIIEPEPPTESPVDESKIASMPTILKHVLEVIKLMKRGKTHTDAVREVANQFNRRPATISDQCSRSLGLNSVDEFRRLYRDGKLENYLKQKFSDNKSEIEKFFNTRGVFEPVEATRATTGGYESGIDRIPITLKHVLEVIKLMKRGLDHPDAVRTVARQSRVTPNTIFAQCSRGLGLNSIDDFRKWYQEGKLENYLKQKFSEYKSEIEKVLK